jgi:hypothetical protein
MESALAPPTRLIEYPTDISDCNIAEVMGKPLLYTCLGGENGLQFVVVLGFHVGRRDDHLIPKQLVEPVDSAAKGKVKEALTSILVQKYKSAKMLFL